MSAQDNLGRQFKFYDMSAFRHQRDDGRWLGEPDKLRVFQGDEKHDNQIGFMTMSHDGSYVDEAWVHPEHRRQGLATQMYDHLQKQMGRKLPLGDDRSDAGEAWATKMGAPSRRVHQKWGGLGLYEP